MGQMQRKRTQTPDGKISSMLYDGKIELIFDPDDHVYTVDGEIVPSVTGINGIFEKPALVAWAVKCGYEYFENTVRPGDVMDEVSIKRVAEGIRWAHKNKMKTACDIGTVAHKYAEDFIRHSMGLGGKPIAPVNESARIATTAFDSWVADHKVAFLATELPIYSIEHTYAGTADIVATVGGERCICDIKTSKAVYVDHVYQIAAYARAVREETGKKLDAGWIIRIDKEKGFFKLVHVTGEGLEEYGEAFAWYAKCYKYRKRGDERMKELQKESSAWIRAHAPRAA